MADATPLDPTAVYRKSLRAEGFVGRSPAMAEVLRRAALFAPLDHPVLLFGGPGLGKGHLARILHESGPRSSGPLVHFYGGAFRDDAVEAELFGPLGDGRGGRFGAARGGTLVMRYVEMLPPVVQTKLLDILRSNDTSVRLIALVTSFRDDLFSEDRLELDLVRYLSEFAIRLPPLPERREDIGELFRFLCSQAVARPFLIVHPGGLTEKVRLSLLEPTAEAIRLAEKRRFSGGLRQFSGEVTAAAWQASQAGRSQIDVSDLDEDPNDITRS